MSSSITRKLTFYHIRYSINATIKALLACYSPLSTAVSAATGKLWDSYKNFSYEFLLKLSNYTFALAI